MRWQFPVWALWSVFTPIVLFLGDRVRVRRDNMLIAIPFHAVSATIVAMLHAAFGVALVRFLAAWEPSETPMEMFIGLLEVRFIFFVFAYTSILVAGYAFEWYRHYRKAQLTTSRLEAQLSSARLEALKSQLHPHFLFNTLQAIAVLVEENPRSAQKMITQLGDLLRHTVDTFSVQHVTLKEELEFLELYLGIERTRFQDRLTVSFDVDPSVLDRRVPSFILQPLVENAIKHGLSKHTGAGTITISALPIDDKLSLTVANSGETATETTPQDWTDGVGLGATRARLEEMYNGDHRIITNAGPSGVEVTLLIPAAEDAIHG